MFFQLRIRNAHDLIYAQIMVLVSQAILAQLKKKIRIVLLFVSILPGFSRLSDKSVMLAHHGLDRLQLSQTGVEV